jgi:hypothetical protein
MGRYCIFVSAMIFIFYFIFWGLIILTIYAFQLVWINPNGKPIPSLVYSNENRDRELMWDHGMCIDTSRGAVVRDLIAKALKGALAPRQQEVIIIWNYCFFFTGNLLFFISDWEILVIIMILWILLLLLLFIIISNWHSSA